MADEQDIEPQEQDHPQDAAAAAETAQAAAASGEDTATPAPGRTLDNLAGEMHRRYGKLEKMVTDLASAIASQQMAAQQQRYQAPPPQQTEYSDEQLTALADQGNTQAQRMLAERAATRVATQHTQAQQVFAQAQQRISELLGLYPALRDPAHPLTQEATRRKAALAGAYQGVDPNLANMLSTIQAINDACTFHPDLAMQARQPAPSGLPADEFSRQQATQTQSVMGGGSVPRRAAPASRGGGGRPAAVQVTAEERALAERYGVDPVRAKENFAKRQADKRSGIGAVGLTIIREQGGQL